MPKFKLIKQLEKNLKTVEDEMPTNFFSKWLKNLELKKLRKEFVFLEVRSKRNDYK